MKQKVYIIVSLICCIVSLGENVSAAEPQRTLTATLLPISENRVDNGSQEPKSAENFLWLQKDQPKEIRLDFDLSGLPSDLMKENFTSCVFRLVARTVIFYPEDKPTEKTGATDILIRGWSAEDDKNSILALSVLSENNPIVLNVKTSKAFRDAVYDKYAGKEKTLSLKLRTNSARASSLFYSTKNFGDTPSNKPRLVIEYTLPPPGLLETASWSQHQQEPEHTGRSPWIPFRAPNGFNLVSIPLPKINENAGAVVDYPLIYQGNLYLISHVGEKNYLLSLDFKGTERWRREIGGGTVQRSPVISRNGIMYVVTEKQIAGYDLTQAGKEYTAKEYKAFSLSETQKLSLYTGLTQGRDGSLFLALADNRQNYVYGFTPHLQPFLKVGPFSTGPKEKISSITVSPDGRKIFAQTPTGAVVIDIVNPSAPRTLTLAKGNDQPWEYYYVPVAGPKNDVVKNDIVIFADFTSTADKGNIWGVSEAQGIWSAPGTLLPQPVLGSNDRIYYIQGGVLYGHKFNEVGVADIFSGAQATAEIANGVVTKVNIKDGGRNYQKAPKVTFTGGDGSGAQATAEITNGVVTKIDIVKSGQDYKNPPNVRFTGELNTSSNLVMDGADNMYFWDDGYLYGYSPEAKPLFEKINFTNQGFERKRAADPEAVSDNDKDKAVRNDKSSGPEQFIRLMIGPDGTLWANNKNGNALYTFKPRYASTDLTPQVVSAIALMAGGTGYTSAPAVQFVGGGGSGAKATAMMLKTQTIYRTEGKLTMSGFTVKNGQQIVLQAGGSMAFAKEFKVEKGASVLCRTGL